ncbi:MAG: A/G-specific adenine glycosylase [Chloroflexi bacterium]|nr:A/G-specific adenine glycosylase [Chloroflexota bacterium]
MTLSLQTRLLKWYAAHARALPWRGARDPYRVWVSEIMLQQTQVDTVIPYYRRWLKHFPTVKALARAPLGEVLAVWEGLGYYSRARNLHKAAQKVVAEFGGKLPRDANTLRKLPGIGRYTAGAIASIAFNADAAVLDGNVKRVLARVFNLTDDVKSAAGEKKLWALAQSLVPPGRAGDYNQAVMDLGATVCRRQQPACPVCPLRGLCEAQKLGVQDQRPVTRKRPPTPHYTVAAGIIRRRRRILIAQRPADKLLGGLWEFPGGKVEAGESLRACLRREVREELGIEIEIGEQRLKLAHAYTHFKITLHAFEAGWVSGKVRALDVADFRWVRPAELSHFAMGKTDRAIAKAVQRRGDSRIAPTD